MHDDAARFGKSAGCRARCVPSEGIDHHIDGARASRCVLGQRIKHLESHQPVREGRGAACWFQQSRCRGTRSPRGRAPHPAQWLRRPAPPHAPRQAAGSSPHCRQTNGMIRTRHRLGERGLLKGKIVRQLEHIRLRNADRLGKRAFARRHGNDLPVGTEVGAPLAARHAGPARHQRIDGHAPAFGPAPG